MAGRANVRFHDVLLRPDPSRTVVTPLEPGYPRGFDGGATRTQETVDFILSLDEAELTRQLEGVIASLDQNHRDVLLRRRFDEMADRFDSTDRCDDARRRLIGAYSRRNTRMRARRCSTLEAVMDLGVGLIHLATDEHLSQVLPV